MVTGKPARPFRGMRRLTLTGAGTATILVLLFSYRTSTGESGTDSPQAVAPAQVVPGSSDTSSAGAAPADEQSSTSAVHSPSTRTTSAADPTTSTSADPTTAAAPRTSAASAPSTTSAAPTKAATSVTVDGAQEMTRYGIVQVRVTISGGKITDVTTLQYPNREQRDMEINSYALPQLRTEVLSAQSAQVDAVSGATFTSEGYLTSLQSALDAAGFQP